MEKRILIPLICAALAAVASPLFAADMPKGDQDFVMKAAQGGHAEIKAGNLAKANAADAGVKQFGEMMVMDHTKAGKELETAAKAASLNFPADTDAKHQQMLDKLSGLKGAAFDKAYMVDMVAGHKEMAKLLESMSKDATKAELKDWAKRTLPAVQTHLKKAEEIQAKLM